jgi:hypothetical protein
MKHEGKGNAANGRFSTASQDLKLILPMRWRVKHILVAVFAPFGECLLFDSFGVCIRK